jgi:hypothetical protein
MKIEDILVPIDFSPGSLQALDYALAMVVTHNGLSNEAPAARLRRHGPNALPERPPTPLWRRFARQFQSPLIYILLFALVADAAIWVSEGATGAPVESIAIAFILLLNAGLGVYQENKSEAALARLKEMAAPMVWVMREGRLVHLPSSELVPGDVARIEAGDRVPADGSLIEAGGVMIDESVLTGESAPVDKALNEEVLSGTLLVRGKGYVEISRTGEKSAMGRLAVMIDGIEAEKTPLERRLEKFGGQIARGVLALAILIAVGGCFKGAVGGALLVAAPLIGFGVLQTRTAIFLHTTIGQLFYAYPARRINAPPQFNSALHLAVILGVGLQLLTVLLPSLRALLRLEPLTLEILTLVSAAVLMTWGAAEAYSRLALSAHRIQEEAT